MEAWNALVSRAAEIDLTDIREAAPVYTAGVDSSTSAKVVVVCPGLATETLFGASVYVFFFFSDDVLTRRSLVRQAFRAKKRANC